MAAFRPRQLEQPSRHFDERASIVDVPPTKFREEFLFIRFFVGLLKKFALILKIGLTQAVLAEGHYCSPLRFIPHL